MHNLNTLVSTTDKVYGGPGGTTRFTDDVVSVSNYKHLINILYVLVVKVTSLY